MAPARANTSWTSEAYSHLNLRIDQRTSTDWNFRLFYWDASFGWEWSAWFAMTLGNVISDMVTSPTAPLIPRKRPAASDQAVADPPVGATPLRAQRNGGCRPEKRKTQAEAQAGAILADRPESGTCLEEGTDPPSANGPAEGVASLGSPSKMRRLRSPGAAPRRQTAGSDVSTAT